MAMDEDDINKLSRELKDFTTGLENFTKVINKNKSSSSSDSSGTPTTPVVDATTKKITVEFDKSTQKIVNSLGQLSAVLTKNARSEAQKERYIQKFNETVQKVTANQEKELERAAIKADRQSRRDEILAKRAEGYQARAEARARASQAESDKRREESDKEYIEKSKEKFENLYKSFEKTSYKVTSFSRNVANSGDSLSNAVDLATTMASGTGKVIGGVGAALGAVAPAMGGLSGAAAGLSAAITVSAAAFTKMLPIVAEGAKLMVQQFEKGLEAFSKLTDVGLVSSFEQLRNLSGEMGLTFQDVVAATSKYSVSLAAAGGTAEQGMEKFAKVAREMELDDVGLKFRALGLSAAQTAEYQARYIAQETRYGLIKNRDAKSLADGTKNYVEQLTMLSRLTGESREALQAKEDAARGEAQYSATLELAKSNPELYQRMVNANMLVESRFDADTAKGLRASAGGIPMGESAETLMYKTGGESLQISQDLQKGLITEIEVVNRLADAMRRNGMMSESTLSQTKMVGEIGGPYKGLAKTFEALNKPNLDEGEAKKILDKVRADQEAAKDPNTYAGASALAQNEIYGLNVKMQQALTNLPALSTILDITTVTVGMFNKALEETVKWFGSEAGSAKNEAAIATSKQKNDEALLKAQSIMKDPKASPDEKNKAAQDYWKASKEYGEAINPSPMGTRSLGAPKTDKVNVDSTLLEAIKSSGISDRRSQANILAQVQAESGGVATKTENLKYTPDQLMEKFPDRFRKISDARRVAAGSEQEIGEAIYGGKNGNSELGDGYKYRGRGLIQLSGKGNYKKFGDLLGVDLLKNPDLAADPEISKKIMMAYINEKKKEGLDLTDSKQLSKAIGHADVDGKESRRREKLSKDIESSMAKSKDVESSMTKSDDPMSLLTFSNKDTGKPKNFLALDSDIQNKVLAAAKEYNSITGSKLYISSAKRDPADQQRLWDETEEAGRPGIGPTGMPVGRPGTSNHEKGRAIDIQQGKSGDAAAITALNRQGLSQTVPNDPVHFQAMDGGVFKGPSTGYDVTMHKNEAVIPLDENGVSKQPLNTALFPQDDSPMKIMISLMEKTNDKYDQIIDLLTTSADNSDKLVAATV